VNDPLKIQLAIAGITSVAGSEVAFSNFLPSGDSYHGDCVFTANRTTHPADYLVVIDDYDQPIVTDCDRASTFYLNSESMIEPDFVNEGSARFLEQFGGVFSPHAMYCDHATNTLPFQPWMIHCGYHQGLFAKSRIDYNYLASIRFPKKKLLSVIASDKGSYHRDHLNHRMRYRFLKALQEYFGNDIDVFGKGFNEIGCKLDGLADYQYTIVLENQSTYNIVTEKLYDAFLAECYPLYYGAPNVHEIFGKDSCSVFHIEDVHGSLRAIDHVIRSGTRERSLSAIAAAKDLTLNKCNWLIRIADVCREADDRALDKTNSTTPRPVTLMPRAHFLKQTERERRLYKIRNKMPRVFRRSTTVSCTR
jgi:hypothetical protein